MPHPTNQQTVRAAWVDLDHAVEVMRDWIAECDWPDLDPDDIASLSPGEVVSAVRRHYEGGVRAFLYDAWMLF